MRRPAAFLAVLCCLFLLAVAVAPRAAAAPDGDAPIAVRHQPPVAAPVVDPFRPPPARRALPEAQERNALERFLRTVPRIARAGAHAVAWAHERVDAVNNVVGTPFTRLRNPVDAWGNLTDEARGWAHYAWSLGVVHQP